MLQYDSEEEWFEYKENWFDAHGIGEYISALSNAAAIRGLEYAYMIWGIEDKTKKIVGTSINYQLDYKGEPYQHYLARLISPSVFFSFNEVYIGEKRVVILEIPAAKSVPTSFDGVRYIRIGSSKENVSRYPTREVALFSALNSGIPSLINQESQYQELTFLRLFTYYAGRGISLKEETFKKNLHLLTKSGKYPFISKYEKE
ncbi:MAG: ATP-binding protein [Spirochaetales bacterium]|nr:ATP-binding protein [Spirochaetales bacterium]